MSDVGEILDSLWRFEAVHPEWTEDESGEDGWEPDVAWWALATRGGLVLIDPLVVDWPAFDELIEAQRGIAGIIRTCHWHERGVTGAADRYGAAIWAKPSLDGGVPYRYDHAVGDGADLFDGLRVFDVERSDEVALWLPVQQALVFGDAMIRRASGELALCPESWTQPLGGRPRLKEILHRLTELPAAHVLVSHGPLVLGDGASALQAALEAA